MKPPIDVDPRGINTNKEIKEKRIINNLKGLKIGSYLFFFPLDAAFVFLAGIEKYLSFFL